MGLKGNMQLLSVLIVDDEAELRKSVISILQTTLPQIQFRIEQAQTGKEAVEKMKSGSFDLVMMDVRMPEMNGLDALKLIKEKNPGTFVVMMTAHSNLADAVAAIK